MRKLIIAALVVTSAALRGGAEGCRVNEVLTGSAAEQAGIRVGDTLLAANGATITAHRDLVHAVKGAAADLKLVVRRGQKTEDVTAHLAPEAAGQSRLGVGCRYDGDSDDDKPVRTVLPHSISAAFGGAFPTTELDTETLGAGNQKIGEPGLHFGAQYLFTSSPRVDIGVEVNRQIPGVHRFAMSPSISEFSMRSTVVMALARFHAPRRSDLTPYILTGLGVHISDFKWEVEPAPGYVWSSGDPQGKRSLVSDRESGLAGLVGVGIEYDVLPTLFVAGEGRFEILSRETYRATSFGDSTGLISVKTGAVNGTLLARIGLRFGSGSIDAPTGSPSPSTPESAPAPKSVPDAAM